jgi:UV DNA damage endonuclease
MVQSSLPGYIQPWFSDGSQDTEQGLRILVPQSSGSRGIRAHMGTHMIRRIGFACKLVDPSGETLRDLNYRSTTVAWLNRQSRDAATQRLWEIMEHNLSATRGAITEVSSWVPELRMMRLGSDMLPVYTEPNWCWFWQQTGVREHLERKLAEIGELARQLDVRLSFHPGQFCCIVSDNMDVVNRSLEELEYHAYMTKSMGFGKIFQDFKINVHLSGRRKISGFDDAFNRMSPELRNCLTIENDEYQAGLNDILPLADRVAIVLDIHHHLVHSNEYIKASDDRLKIIKDSWKGVRPVIHYSQSREEYLTCNILPDFKSLSEQFKKTKLRAHSDFYKHRPTNEWAFEHYSWADVMAESKKKNIASADLFNQWKEYI